MAVIRELVCDCGAILAAADQGPDKPAVRCPVCGNLADVELSGDLVGTNGSFDPTGPAVQVVFVPSPDRE